ncbi:glycine cleavage system protein T [Desulfonema ishimotonii]|uniref:Glycine cleavage system protein T n=1 Tax=Desulfonema ishimotonii TaxID=45657 RepID=A0A401G2C9_9BACT|nr:aminomethyl transferase family protein [Desulfonema ishimotonii]GBC63366.1 glycine cleavage system protein T [Desulfonema ishimotonii]
MANTSKKTLLHGWHTAHGANMADFGGYEMPLWYSSAKNEHLAVLTHAGVFDTSHMATVLVKGAGAYDLLQFCFTNNLSACIGPKKAPIAGGRCVYGAFLNERGEVIDDAIIFKIQEQEYMVVVNAGMGGPVAEHFAANRGDRELQITDLTDRLGKMDIQGPLAARVMKKVLADPEAVFEKMVYFSFKGHFDAASPLSEAVRLTDGTPVMLSRTGYTGEFGFEIFVAPTQFVNVWEMVLAAGGEFGVVTCGLAARDSLRAGAGLPLSHQDIGLWPFVNHPWPFALPYNEDRTGFTKIFIGSDALTGLENAEYTLPFAGNDLRKVTLPASVLDTDGNEIGTVLTCATDMALGRHESRIYSVVSPDQPEGLKIKGLSCGFVKVNKQLAPGDVITLKDSRRKISVRIETNIRPGRTARRPMKEML